MALDLNQTVYTPLGKGRVVYTLSDGSVLVEFPHGGGQVFRRSELFSPVKGKPHESGANGQVHGRPLS